MDAWDFFMQRERRQIRSHEDARIVTIDGRDHEELDGHLIPLDLQAVPSCLLDPEEQTSTEGESIGVPMTGALLLAGVVLILCLLAGAFALGTWGARL